MHYTKNLRFVKRQLKGNRYVHLAAKPRQSRSRMAIRTSVDAARDTKRVGKIVILALQNGQGLLYGRGEAFSGKYLRDGFTINVAARMAAAVMLRLSG